MKKLKVGFIMGGGVSMGSFSAGALKYTLDSFKENLNKDAYTSCEVDVFTGSSAGSVTLALSIIDQLKGSNEDDSWLKRLWVSKDEGLDIQTLSPKGTINHKRIALFHDDIIDNIKERILKEEVPRFKNSSDIFSDQVILGMTLTNLVGIKRDLRDTLVDEDNNLSSSLKYGKDALINYSSADYRYFRIKLDDETGGYVVKDQFNEIGYNSKEGWSVLMSTAAASGAFPLAFAPKKLKRTKEEYKRFWPYEDKNKDFIYSDGGLFNNSPIDHALHLANELDQKDDNYDRVFIFIDPIIGSHPARDDEWIDQNVPFKLKGKMGPNTFNQGLILSVKTYLRIMRQESSFLHFNNVDKKNNQLKWLQKTCEYLVQIIPHVPDDLKDLEKINEEIETELKKIVRTKFFKRVINNRNAPELTLEKINNYIKKQHKTISSNYSSLKDFDQNSTKTNLLLNLIALIENTSGLRKKQTVNMVAIGINNEDELKVIGDDYAAFKGFFNHEWRKYDYSVGKNQAYSVLKGLKNDQGTEVFKTLKKPTLHHIDEREESNVSNNSRDKMKLIIRNTFYMITGSRFVGWMSKALVRLMSFKRH